MDQGRTKDLGPSTKDYQNYQLNRTVICAKRE